MVKSETTERQRALSESLRPKLNNQYYHMELFITENVV